MFCIIFSSGIYGQLGYYNVLSYFHFTEIQNFRNKSVFYIFFCWKNTFNTLVRYFLCRFFFVISKKENIYNNRNIVSFINFYIHFVLCKYNCYDLFLKREIVLMMFLFLGVYIFIIYIFFIVKKSFFLYFIKIIMVIFFFLYIF